MADNDKTSEPTPPAAPAVPGAPGVPGAPPVPPKRSPGHRGADVKDTVAEMAAKAHEISLEAGSKMAAAMKDVINAAAGLSGFVIESARDLVQYMVRRGQMTQEEADKLIREVEAALPKKKPAAASHASAKSAAPHKPAHKPAHTPTHTAARPHPTPTAKKPEAKMPAPKKAAPRKPAPKKAPAKKAAAKKPAPKKSAPAKSKKSAKKSRR
jgi:hypothetical protein